MTTIMKKRKEMDIKLYYFYLYYLFSEPSERYNTLYFVSSQFEGLTKHSL